MPEHGLYSYRVLFFERRTASDSGRPPSIPRDALVTVTTHDLPPLASFWEGSDIDLRERLGLCIRGRARRSGTRSACLGPDPKPLASAILRLGRGGGRWPDFRGIALRAGPFSYPARQGENSCVDQRSGSCLDARHCCWPLAAHPWMAARMYSSTRRICAPRFRRRPARRPAPTSSGPSRSTMTAPSRRRTFRSRAVLGRLRHRAQACWAATRSAGPARRRRGSCADDAGRGPLETTVSLASGGRATLVRAPLSFKAPAAEYGGTARGRRGCPLARPEHGQQRRHCASAGRCAPALADFSDEIIYWALTDRFLNGDPSNDNGLGDRRGDAATRPTPSPGTAAISRASGRRSRKAISRAWASRRSGFRRWCCRCPR
jgi:hypothetical protein